MHLVVGLVAAALTIASFVAQAFKILKTRDVNALSAPTWAMSTTAFAIWVVYGLLLGAWPLVVPNAVCFVLAGFILALKLMSKRRRDAIAKAIT